MFNCKIIGGVWSHHGISLLKWIIFLDQCFWILDLQSFLFIFSCLTMLIFVLWWPSLSFTRQWLDLSTFNFITTSISTTHRRFFFFYFILLDFCVKSFHRFYILRSIARSLNETITFTYICWKICTWIGINKNKDFFFLFYVLHFSDQFKGSFNDSILII